MSDTQPYIVRQGEHLSKIAYSHGVDAVQIWKSAENESLRTSGRDPDVLLPGDVLRLPQRTSRMLSICLGDSNSLSAQVPIILVSVRFLELGRPVANAPCRVSWYDVCREICTDADGVVAFEVPVLVRWARVYFPDRRAAYEFAIGDLDPHDTRSGIAQRLGNLGYLRSSVGEAISNDELIDGSLKRFLASNTASGTDLVEATALLRASHGV